MACDLSISITGSTISDNVARGGDNTPAITAAYGGGVWTSISPPPPSPAAPSAAIRPSAAMAGPGYSSEQPTEAPSATMPTVSISGSTFDHNQAIAGNGGNSGPGQAAPDVDYGFGGAIATPCFRQHQCHQQQLQPQPGHRRQ